MKNKTALRILCREGERERERGVECANRENQLSVLLSLAYSLLKHNCLEFLWIAFVAISSVSK
jgi:hypothetical protein